MKLRKLNLQIFATLIGQLLDKQQQYHTRVPSLAKLDRWKITEISSIYVLWIITKIEIRSIGDVKLSVRR
ncbi:hypothetical protein R1flu_002622 [Riccia fluitans]|uniref:Uncharacterized protein n=1 Tax=Riccia fluitans TaxID=41844 RepID=A0ABD1Y9L4_9MARC